MRFVCTRISGKLAERSRRNSLFSQFSSNNFNVISYIDLSKDQIDVDIFVIKINLVTILYDTILSLFYITRLCDKNIQYI